MADLEPQDSDDAHGGNSASGAFPATRWSLIAGIRGTSEAVRKAALSDLCKIYWRPLFVYGLGRGYSRQDAEDFVQGYLAELLQRESLLRARRSKGKLRSFLLSGFKRFLAGEYRSWALGLPSANAVPRSRRTPIRQRSDARRHALAGLPQPLRDSR